MAEQIAVPRRFLLQRDEDATGVSGTGVVAEGVMLSDGVCVVRWLSAFPTSVVFHDRGLASIEAVHGHGGKTRIVWLDEGEPIDPATVERPGMFDDADPLVWSRTSVGDKRLTWREQCEGLEAERGRLSALANVLSDLDRCEHGRHEGDQCSGAAGCDGPSHGNPVLVHELFGRKLLGFTLEGRPVLLPPRERRRAASAFTEHAAHAPTSHLRLGSRWVDDGDGTRWKVTHLWGYGAGIVCIEGEHGDEFGGTPVRKLMADDLVADYTPAEALAG